MANKRRPIGDPRKLGGKMVDVAGDPLARGGVVLDTTNAVLLDGVEVCLIDAVRRGRLDPRPTLAMTLRGRINRSTDRAEVLYTFDEDGAAAIVTELLGLAVRMGPEFDERFRRRLEEVIRQSTPPAG